MKSLLLFGLFLLLLGGIVGTSFDVFEHQPHSRYVSIADNEGPSSPEKMSMRQIDSLSASSNLSFTIKNSLR